MSTDQNVILIPTDFSEQSLIALSQSYNIARFLNAKILLLHVISDEKKREEAREELEQIAQDTIKRTGLNVQTMIKSGNAFKEINNVAEIIRPAMIMMGITDTIKPKHIMGQNAFRMVRECEFPVITIRGKVHREGCKNIVLPLDLTKETREKVGKAIEIAKYFGAMIRIVSVLTQKDEASENKLLAYSNQVRDFVQKAGVRCSINTERGKDIPEIVVRYAKQVDADLVIIMSKAELNLQEMFIGTTAQRIVSTLDIPVLSIRPKKRKDTSVAVSPF